MRFSQKLSSAVSFILMIVLIGFQLSSPKDAKAGNVQQQSASPAKNRVDVTFEKIGEVTLTGQQRVMLVVQNENTTTIFLRRDPSLRDTLSGYRNLLQARIPSRSSIKEFRLEPWSMEGLSTELTSEFVERIPVKNIETMKGGPDAFISQRSTLTRRNSCEMPLFYRITGYNRAGRAAISVAVANWKIVGMSQNFVFDDLISLPRNLHPGETATVTEVEEFGDHMDGIHVTYYNLSVTVTLALDAQRRVHGVQRVYCSYQTGECDSPKLVRGPYVVDGEPVRVIAPLCYDQGTGQIELFVSAQYSWKESKNGISFFDFGYQFARFWQINGIDGMTEWGTMLIDTKKFDLDEPYELGFSSPCAFGLAEVTFVQQE